MQYLITKNQPSASSSLVMEWIFIVFTQPWTCYNWIFSLPFFVFLGVILGGWVHFNVLALVLTENCKIWWYTVHASISTIFIAVPVCVCVWVIMTISLWRVLNILLPVLYLEGGGVNYYEFSFTIELALAVKCYEVSYWLKMPV